MWLDAASACRRRFAAKMFSGSDGEFEGFEEVEAEWK